MDILNHSSDGCLKVLFPKGNWTFSLLNQEVSSILKKNTLPISSPFKPSKNLSGKNKFHIILVYDLILDFGVGVAIVAGVSLLSYIGEILPVFLYNLY